MFVASIEFLTLAPTGHRRTLWNESLSKCRERFVLGTADDSDQRIPSKYPTVAKHHCVFLTDGLGVRIQNLTRGVCTLVNKVQLVDDEVRQLDDGDEIDVGPLRLKLHLQWLPDSHSDPTSGLASQDLIDEMGDFTYDPDDGMSPRVFVSCVSNDFRQHRNELAKLLVGQDVTPVVQEDFGCGPDKLLEFLHQAVKQSRLIVHLIGDLEGARPPKPAVDAIVPLIRDKLLEPLPSFYELTFTQWEAVFAIAYHRLLVVYVSGNCQLQLDPQTVPSGPTASQQRHLCWLLQHDKHMVVGFKSSQELRERVVRDIGMVLAEAKHRHRLKHLDYQQSKLKALFDPVKPLEETERELQGRKLDKVTVHGRKWLYDGISNWLDEKGSNVFWLQAEAGFGKSAFCTKLVKEWNGDRVGVDALVFCNPGTGPLEVLRGLCRQLRASSPEYDRRFCEAWSKIPWDQIKIPKELDQEGPEQELFADTLMGPLLLQPLKTSVDGSGKNRLLVIDGLDEVFQRKGGEYSNPLRKFLPRLLRSPVANYRIVLTSRPVEMHPQLSTMVGDCNPRTRIPTLDEQEKDARIFVKLQLPPEWHSPEVMDVVLNRSHSSMLYLHYLEKEVAEQKVTPKDAAHLPRGLPGYYLAKMSEYFPDGEGFEIYRNRIRPCLEAIAAGESTDITERDLADCFGADDMRDRMASMKAMIVTRPFMIQRGRVIDGTLTNIFVPFHLSFMDWLVGRDAQASEPHRFQISANHGDVILGNWAERELEKAAVPDSGIVPNPTSYWVRQGAEHLLRSFTNCGSPEQLEKYGYLVKAVDLLGWLNRFPQSSVIVARSLSLVARTLLQTTNNDLNLTPRVLAALEPVDQQILYELVKNCGATEIIDNVIWWIGRTQLDHEIWLNLVEQVIETDEWVLRFGAARGQAARYKRLTDPRENLASEKRAWANQEINHLLNHPDLNYQELGATAVGEIAKTQTITTDVEDWLKQLSASDLYFCQVILGDLMIHLMMSDSPSAQMTLEFLDQEKIIEPFWNPIWQMTKLDVVRVLTLNDDKKMPWQARRMLLESEVQRALEAFQVRNEAVQAFQSLAGSSGQVLAKILSKPEINSADQEVILEWLKNSEPEKAVNLAIEFLHLVFTHTSWRVLEKGSSLISELEAQTHNQEMSIAILDGLLDSFGTKKLEALDPTGRVIYGTAEACFLTKHFAGDRDFQGLPMPRLDYCILHYYQHPNCEVRGLLAENVDILIREELENPNAYGAPDIRSILMKFDKPIRYWLHDPDIWVLEHVYQVFQIIREHMEEDGPLRAWYKRALAYVHEKQDCLLALISKECEPGDHQEWVDMDRERFLRAAQRVRRRIVNSLSNQP